MAHLRPGDHIERIEKHGATFKYVPGTLLEALGETLGKSLEARQGGAWARLLGLSSATGSFAVVVMSEATLDIATVQLEQLRPGYDYDWDANPPVWRLRGPCTVCTAVREHLALTEDTMYYGICKKPGLNSSGEVEWLPQEALSGSWGELMTSTSMVVAAKWADVLANANPTTPLNFPDELWQLVAAHLKLPPEMTFELPQTTTAMEEGLPAGNLDQPAAQAGSAGRMKRSNSGPQQFSSSSKRPAIDGPGLYSQGAVMPTMAASAHQLPSQPRQAAAAAAAGGGGSNSKQSHVIPGPPATSPPPSLPLVAAAAPATGVVGGTGSGAGVSPVGGLPAYGAGREWRPQDLESVSELCGEGDGAGKGGPVPRSSLPGPFSPQSGSRQLPTRPTAAAAAAGAAGSVQAAAGVAGSGTSRPVGVSAPPGPPASGLGSQQEHRWAHAAAADGGGSGSSSKHSDGTPGASAVSAPLALAPTAAAASGVALGASAAAGVDLLPDRPAGGIPASGAGPAWSPHGWEPLSELFGTGADGYGPISSTAQPGVSQPAAASHQLDPSAAPAAADRPARSAGEEADRHLQQERGRAPAAAAVAAGGGGSSSKQNGGTPGTPVASPAPAVTAAAAATTTTRGVGTGLDGGAALLPGRSTGEVAAPGAVSECSYEDEESETFSDMLNTWYAGKGRPVHGSAQQGPDSSQAGSRQLAPQPVGPPPAAAAAAAAGTPAPAAGCVQAADPQLAAGLYGAAGKEKPQWLVQPGEELVLCTTGMSPGGTLSVRLEVHRGLGYGGEAQVLLVEELPQPGVLQMMGPGHATAAGGDATAAAAAAAADTAGTSSSSAAAAAAVEGSLLCALKITRPWEWMVEMYEKEHPGCSIPVTQEQYLQHCQQTMQKEFDLLSKCKGSPHIVQAYYVGVVHVHGYGSLPALLMEYCAGGCLTDYLARCFEFYKTGLSYEDARHIMNSTYTAMCGFHEKGIGHRDLKSHNVLLTKWPPLQPGQPPLPLSEMGEVRVSDLGLAWEFKPGVPCRLTTSTPDYRPPELDSGRASDLTADSWAFGCLLLSARTAQRPFPHLPVGDARRGPGELDNPQGPYHDLLKPDEKALLRELLEQRGQRKILSDVADGHPAYFAEAASYR